jgi:hypothetical protein
MLLIWNNCMLYNAVRRSAREGATRLAGRLLLLRAGLAPQEGVCAHVCAHQGRGRCVTLRVRDAAAAEMQMDREPSVDERKRFSQSLYLVGAEELGKTVQILDSRCPDCIRKVRPRHNF